MSVEDCYIRTQLNFLEIMLALASEAPKRSGDFETTYKTENGKEVVVKRSPDGKFANKNGGASSQEATVSTASVGKTFGKAVGGLADEIAKMPAKVQDAVRKAMFDSELSRAIDKGVEKFIKFMSEPAPGMKLLNKAYGSGLEVGFKLGQSIKDELAKKPFSKFAETVAAKFEEFRKDLPQKSDDLRKEIIRIAKDPNTATTVAAGALMALAGNFAIAGIFNSIRAGSVAFGLLKLPSVAKYAAEIMKATPVAPGLAMTEEAATAMATGVLNATKAIGAAFIVGETVMGVLYYGVAGILTSHAGRAIMNRSKSNEAIEKEQLKEKILATPDDSDELYQEMIDQDKKDQETKQKILAGLRQETSQEDLVNTMMALTVPSMSIDIGKRDEDYLTNNPSESSRIFQKVYEESSVKLLFAKLDTAMSSELQAMFADKPVPESESQVEGIKKEIEDTIAKLVKAEIAQTNPKNSLTSDAAQTALATTLLGAADEDLKAKLINSDLDPGIQKL